MIVFGCIYIIGNKVVIAVLVKIWCVKIQGLSREQEKAPFSQIGKFHLSLWIVKKVLLWGKGLGHHLPILLDIFPHLQ
jgi:hypothetical protein